LNYLNPSNRIKKNHLLSNNYFENHLNINENIRIKLFLKKLLQNIKKL
jgi:hypothetical protein